MTCSSTSGNRAVLAISKAVAEQETDAPVSRTVCERSFHDLLREGRSLDLPTPNPEDVRAWFAEQEFVADLEISSTRSRDAALKNLQAAREAYEQDPSSLSPAVFHAWKYAAGYTGYAAGRKEHPAPITVAFDCDGVLYQFNDTLREWLAARGWDRERMPDPSVYSLHDAWGLSMGTLHKEMPLAIRAGVLWHAGESFTEGVSSARAVGQAGHQVMVNTARALPDMEGEARAATATWLRGHGVHVDHLHLADPFRSEDKLSAPFDVLFDDHPDNVATAIEMGRHAYVVDQPWNRFESNLPRVGYDEITDVVESLASARV